MSCLCCSLIEEKKGLLYEDDQLIAILHPKPNVAGHVILIPKKHTPIIEQLPNEIMGELFVKANTISTALFENLGAQGTNIFVQNGIEAGQFAPHVMVHVIPRIENDGLALTWQPKQITEEEMETLLVQLQKECENIGKEEVVEVKEGEDPKELGKAENYLLKQLRRIP